MAPQDSLAGRPHEKSRTLGEIAAHIANLPGLFIATLNQDEFDRHAEITNSSFLSFFGLPSPFLWIERGHGLQGEVPPL